MKRILMAAVIAAIVATGCKKKTETEVIPTDDGVVVTKTTTVDNTATDYDQMKMDMRREMAETDKQMAVYREKMKTKTGQAKIAMKQQMDTMEARRMRFNNRMENWKEDGKEDWQTFKSDMETSRSNMKQDFEDFRKNN